jgi:hypothetical protein
MSCSGARASSPWPRVCKNALWAVGRVPLQHRGDRLSAAKPDTTRRAATRPLRASRHGADPQQSRCRARERVNRKPHLKQAVEGALLLRGPSDFDGLAAYRRLSTRSSAGAMPGRPSGSLTSARRCNRCRWAAPMTKKIVTNTAREGALSLIGDHLRCAFATASLTAISVPRR